MLENWLPHCTMDETQWCDRMHNVHTHIQDVLLHKYNEFQSKFTDIHIHNTHLPIYVYLDLTRKHSAVACLSTKTGHIHTTNCIERVNEGCVIHSEQFFNELVSTRLLTYNISSIEILYGSFVECGNQMAK